MIGGIVWSLSVPSPKLKRNLKTVPMRPTFPRGSLEFNVGLGVDNSNLG